MTTRKHFKNRNAMLHFVASTDYEDDVIYYTDGGKTWFCNDRFYRNNICVGYVDREAEQVCRNISLGENTSLWRYTRELFDAFKHYEPFDLTSFNGIDAGHILDKALISIKAIKNPNYYHHKAYVLAYKTVLFLAYSLPSDEMKEQFKKSLKFVKDEDEKNEKERKKREKAQKAFDKKCFEISKKYTKGLLIGKDWNEKLKNFCSKNHKVYISVEEWKELKDIVFNTPFYNPLFSLASPDWGFVDGVYKQKNECPDNPYINFSAAILNHSKGLPVYADFLYLDEGVIRTSRGVSVEDYNGLVRRLLKKFMASSDEARKKFIGLHVGSFVIREWNPEQRYLQVGCHRFYEQTLKEFADYCERTTK